MRTRTKSKTEGSGIEDEESFATAIERIFKNSNKPMVTVLDSGSLYDAMAEKILKAGIPVFRSADSATERLARYAMHRIEK